MITVLMILLSQQDAKNEVHIHDPGADLKALNYPGSKAEE
jgi:hypothetical protein